MKTKKYYIAPKAAIEYPEGPNGRQVCNLKTAAGKREYEARRTEMWLRQKGLCPICGTWMDENESTFEHEDLRGMGGARRDDRIWKLDEEGNKMPLNFAVHGKCNSEKGSKRNLSHQEVA